MFKLKSISFVGLLLGAAVFSGCDDKEKQPDIKVENGSLTQIVYADQTDGKSEVTFVTAGAWTSSITEGTTKSTKGGVATWLSISPDRGNAAGEYTIVIRLEPNYTNSDRSATVTITCNDMDITIAVTQKATKEDGKPATEAPLLTTAEVSAITTVTATAGGNITDAGKPAYTERGVCYATTPTPTVAGTKVTVAGTSTGNFTANLADLTPNTTYYVRAYATNSVGTAYGNEVSFTTEAIAPALTTAAVTAITVTTATAGGNISNAGTPAYTERGVCFATTANPTVDGTKVVVAGTGTGGFTANLTGLTASTTYYVRAYATTSAGTVYGNEVSFTTEPEIEPMQMTMITEVQRISILLQGTGTATIDWGDGLTPQTRTLTVNNSMLYTREYTNSSAHTITISGANITTLWVDDAGLTSLDVSDNTALTQLRCGNNQLASLDVSKNTALTILYCDRNLLMALDVSGNTRLMHLICHDNLLTVLDVSSNIVLEVLTCGSNNLSTAALNSLFGTLHNNLIYGKIVQIGANPGTDYCNRSIATNKGWIVEVN